MGGSQFKDSDHETVELKHIINHIAEATGGFIDYVAITHEHADHVNGFNKKGSGDNLLFDQITFGHLWLAWTEDGGDDFANALRQRFGDQLVALALAEQRIANSNVDKSTREDVAHLLEMELGSEEERKAFAADLKSSGQFGFASSENSFKIDGITNKKAIKYLRDNAQSGPEFLRPDQSAFPMAGTTGARVYVLGPPRD